jgi:DNA mismatch endonuclease, patch repair protein
MASSATVRQVMIANYGGNTTPERLLRRALFKVGVRFRLDVQPVPSLRCKADIVFRAQRVCIFVDGCFWHGCPRHFKCPKTNGPWWEEKIKANRVRDVRQAKLLKKHGWKVVRVWEHDLKPEQISSAVSRIRNILCA